MTEEEIKQILQETSSILKGHFKLSSGFHSDTYIQCACALKYPEIASKLADAIYQKTSYLEPDIIVSPALGGIIIGWEVARKYNLPFLFTERENGIMKLRRGFKIEQAKRVLIIEDVFTTGKSTLEVKDVIDDCKGVVVGAASIIERGSFKFPFPHHSLLHLELVCYKPDNCPLCKMSVPLVKPGSRN